MPYFQGIYSIEDWEQYFKVLRIEEDVLVGVYVSFQDRNWCRARIGRLPYEQRTPLEAFIATGDCLKILPMPSDLGAFTNWCVLNLTYMGDPKDRDLVAQMNSAANSSVFKGW
jgi:hypothetical protein